MKRIHIFAFQSPFGKKKKKIPSPSNLEHIVKYSTYESKNGIKVEELPHTKLVFAI